MGGDKNFLFNQSPARLSYFNIQWHLTARCQQNCLHCYMRDEPTYLSELENELDHKTCLKIIDDYVDSFGEKCRLQINFTGGDPLLRKDIFDLLKYARKRGIRVNILGNPNLVTPKIAKDLKKVGLGHYQLSIDGLEKTHDKLRGRKGLFKDTLRAIKVLEDAGVATTVMFTVSKINAEELIRVIHVLVEKGVSVFDFARFVPIGSGRGLREAILTPHEYHKLLLQLLYEYKRLNEKGVKTVLGQKENLWNLLFQELGFFKPDLKIKHLILGGCSLGSSILTILADGTVYSCRRLPVKIGKVPEQSLWDIFINSPEHNKIRRGIKNGKCRGCNLFQYCRGCPAVTYGVYSDYSASDPQCWKEVNQSESKRGGGSI